MAYADRFLCPYCGAPMSARWWRRRGHQFRVPWFWFLRIGAVLGTIASVFTGAGTLESGPESDELKDTFALPCKRCGALIPVPKRD